MAHKNARKGEVALFTSKEEAEDWALSGEEVGVDCGTSIIILRALRCEIVNRLIQEGLQVE